MKFYLNSAIEQSLNPKLNYFQQLLNLNGQVYRQQKSRLTERICLNNHYYFIKKYFGIGWREIFKNLCLLRLPICSAENEWRALQKLRALGIKVPKVLAYGKLGKNPARIKSFVLLQELNNMTTLEALAELKQPIDFATKLLLIKKVAEITRIMHQHGINHRDYYLCHFFLDANNDIYLIDLHRAQIRKKVPARWVIKDLAGLYFSSYNLKLTRKDYLRFIKYYNDKPLSLCWPSQTHFWQKVVCRGRKLQRKHYR